MTLTEADVARLEAAGHTGFMRLDNRGDLMLVNRAGACVFLEEGRCRVYDVRPEGCRFYPLVLDLVLDRVVRDDGCPHCAEFSAGPGLARQLRLSVAREEAEASRRRRKNG